MNQQAGQSTPSRDRLQPSRADTSITSPSSVRVTPSAGTTSNASGISIAPLSVQGLLSAHASASNPALAALEAAISERNTFATHNAQLWRLVEKQRAVQASLTKDVDRLRGERDCYREGLREKGVNVDALLRARKEKERREGKDSLRSAGSHAHLRGERGSEGATASQNGHGLLEPRANLLRANSDDIGKSPSAPIVTIEQAFSFDCSCAAWSDILLNILAFQRSLSSSQSASNESFVQARSTTRERQGSQASLSIPPSTLQSSTSNLSLSQTPSSHVSHSQSGPVSAASSTTHLPFSERTADVRTYYAEPEAGFASPPATARPLNASYAPAPPVPSLQTQLEPQAGTSSGLQKQAVQPQVIVQSASSQPVDPVEASSGTVMPENAATGSRELNGGELTLPGRTHHSAQASPVSLPEEAKRYYTMNESPMPSPRSKDGFQDDRSGYSSTDIQAEPTNQPRVDSPNKRPQKTQIDQRSNSLPNPYDTGPPSQAEPAAQDDTGFLDLEETDSVYDSQNDSGRASAVDSVDPDDYPAAPEVATDADTSRTTRKPAAVDDFPLPPTSPPIPPPSEASLQSQFQQQQAQALQRMHSDPGEAPQALSVNTAAISAPELMTKSISEASRISSVSSLVPLAEIVSQGTFRALPLLSSDLPSTTIEVTNSSIRPNDRGKEVLSFIISVNPGRGKEGWKVEKLYSDVLTLDARVRATIGKSMGKKLATLPEGRLWKDHAPAKVDQRKVTLEYYLRSLISLPVKNKDEVVSFFTTDILRSAQKPVAQAGYKEGYLTKRGKNFGGWKTRYFVLQGPSLEYYESRGGTHLGSITITGAQIGRQQRALDKKDADEDNEYRHAFLIIEAKRGPGGPNPRHVLCAESDLERDSWVEELVRYVSGAYNDEEFSVVQNGQMVQAGVGRASTSSTDASTPSRRRKDEIAKGSAVPISQLAPDASNAKLFQKAPSPSDDSSSVTSPSRSTPASYVDQFLQSDQTLVSSSLPSSSPLGADDTESLAPVGPRANSEMGHYPDLADPRAGASSKSRPGFASPEQRRKDKRRSINPLKASPIPERTPSPEKEAALQTPRVDTHGKVKISGPMNGTPIPAGYKFGKDAPPEAPSASDRREKAKSRSFWGFGGAKHDKPIAPVHVPRAVFGVSLEESLDIAEIASLPAIVFRCIQYLEAKKADQEEGIYRLSGSSAVIKSLKDRFNNEGDVDLLGSDEYWDPHAIAGLLKTYLRELPASILTRDLHLRFLSVIADFVDPQERIQELSRLIASLPTANYSLLRALTAHLILIVQNAHVNKMTMRNVGIVFSPTLGIPAGVFSLMLGEFKRVFNVDGALVDGPAEPEGTAESVEISRRNSKHYSDADADRLLGLSGRTLSAPEESQSDVEESSLHDESGTEGTDNAEIESIVESSAASSVAYLTQPDPAQDVEQDANALSPGYRGRASNVAASRGLNIAVADKASRRHSRMVGLPHSPRPAQDGGSPHTPQRGSPAPASPSPLHTPK
ncbi:hypothetical protein EIP86_009219 [Pleurotus ostreatoroseus]|nr:hypothetical protein EIP86_009219 [Pleurotus ostreatoroseus]